MSAPNSSAEPSVDALIGKLGSRQHGCMHVFCLLWMHRYSLRCLEQGSQLIQQGARSRASSSIFVAMSPLLLHRPLLLLLYSQVSPSLAYLTFHHPHICSGHRLCQVYSVDSIVRLLLLSPSCSKHICIAYSYYYTL